MTKKIVLKHMTCFACNNELPVKGEWFETIWVPLPTGDFADYNYCKYCSGDFKRDAEKLCQKENQNFVRKYSGRIIRRLK